MDANCLRTDLAKLKQRISKVFGERITLARLVMHSSEIGEIIKQSLATSEHLLQYVQGVETRLIALETKR